jgi:poly-gamma-glutamate capsule biosynthesis protein CapA/YwtB (metallophosphatase superfamily)
MSKLTLCAVGDVRVDHEKVGRSSPEEVFEHCVDVFRSADVNFFNCEGLYTERTFTVPAQHTPGVTPPENFTALTWAGFHVAALANNHALDLGAEGLLDTIDLCRDNGIEVCGAGRNLAEARTPAIVERNGTRVAFLAYNCVGPVEYAARSDRAGLAPLRVTTHYEPIEYQPGTPCKILTFADRDDLAALLDDIARARELADVVAVSFHWGLHHVEAMISMYQQEIAHAAIDAGADVILGGADHVVKGIEVYAGKVIYYGMGDFILDTPLTEKTQTAWRKMKHRIYDLHYDPAYPAYPFPPEARNHFIAKVDFTDGQLARAAYVPCMVNPMGQPEALSVTDERFEVVRHYIQAISEDQGFNVRFTVEGDEVVIGDAGIPSRPVGPAYTKLMSSGNTFSR